MIDKLIIGAGLYGLYAALHCAKKGQRVTVLELDEAPFSRATYINQARVHMGYHYPRSLSTAMKSASYFRRFVDDYGFCILFPAGVRHVPPFFLDRRGRIPKVLPGREDSLRGTAGGGIF